ncbi:hypothetical protein EZS27_003880 [termite gut metagenome]|uniref:Phage capsid-like C-terminal domain-containing protein n=1 Tax=termite gut metagenome TaxID=433724 RepID=A0A5J4SRK2_9ZZZZ
MEIKGIDFLQFLDVTKMSEEDKKSWEAVSESFKKASVEFFKGNIDMDKLKEEIARSIKASDDFKKPNLDEFVKGEEYKKKMEEVEKTLLDMKGEMETASKGGNKEKSLEEQLREGLKDCIKIKDGVEKVNLRKACEESPARRKKITLSISQKAGTIISGGVAPHTGIYLDPKLSVDPRQQTVIRRFANIASIGDRMVYITEYVPGAGNAEWVPEGGLKPAMDAALTETNVSLGKVALTAKFSEETLTDLPQLVAEVRAEIISRIGIKEEDGILNGTGAGGEIVGVLPSVPGFVLTDLTVPTPNMYDAIVASYTQIVSTSKMNYRPNLVLMNPIDVATMRLTKDSQGRYLLPFKYGDELIDDLRTESSTAVNQGEFFMGDFNFLNIRDRTDLEITWGWENDDFTKNLVTCLGEKRLLVYIKKQYITAFLYDSFENVITAITA